MKIWSLSFIMLFGAVGQAAPSVVDTRLVMTITDRDTNTKIIRSYYASIGEETVQVTADPRCNSPEAVTIPNSIQKRVGDRYIFCGEPVKRQALSLTQCNGLSDSCQEVWSGDRSDFEGGLEVRCRIFETPGVSDFVMGTDSYRLDPTIRDFCRNSVSNAKTILVTHVRSLGTSNRAVEGIYPVYAGQEDFFKRFITYRDPIGRVLLKAQELIRK